MQAALGSAERVERACSAVLGRGVVAVVLHGSLVLGDFVCGRSDIDLLAIVRDQPSSAQLAALLGELSLGTVRGQGPVDLRLVTAAVAAVPSPAPRLEAYVRLVPGAKAEVEVVGAAERDLAVELSVCRAHGRSLSGPAPRALIASIPDGWVDEAGAEQLVEWQGLAGDAERADLMVLTSCRVWRYAVERRHCSKREAAEWVVAREPVLAAPHAALGRRAGGSDRLPERDVSVLLARVLREVEHRRAAGAQPGGVAGG